MAVWATLAYFWSLDLATVLAACIYTLLTAISFFWDLRDKSWFWYAMIAIVAVHAVALTKAAWSSVELPFPLLPFLFGAMILDFGVIYAFVGLIENIANKSLSISGD